MLQQASHQLNHAAGGRCCHLGTYRGFPTVGENTEGKPQVPETGRDGLDTPSASRCPPPRRCRRPRINSAPTEDRNSPGHAARMRDADTRGQAVPLVPLFGIRHRALVGAKPNFYFPPVGVKQIWTALLESLLRAPYAREMHAGLRVQQARSDFSRGEVLGIEGMAPVVGAFGQFFRLCRSKPTEAAGLTACGCARR